MKNLFLIDGAAGSGKSDFFDFINEVVGTQMNNFAIALPKYTSRERRPGEEKSVKDLFYFEGNEQERLNKYHETIENLKASGEFVYEYVYGVAHYAIEKSRIEEALKNFSNVYIIIRSSYCINMIAQTFSKYTNVNVVPIFIYSDKGRVKQRLKLELTKKLNDLSIPDGEKEKIISEQIQMRISRTNIAMDDYYSQTQNIYKEIIINNSNKIVYMRQLREILDKYNTYALNDNKVFIIMPIGESKDEQNDNNSIKNAIVLGAKDAGMQATRTDDMLDNNGQLIIQKVYEGINSAQVCIVDLSKNRPNCYLELGYARAKNKKIILIASYENKNKPYIHFDEQGYNCYYYETTPGGLNDLRVYIQYEIAMWRKECLI